MPLSELMLALENAGEVKALGKVVFVLDAPKDKEKKKKKAGDVWSKDIY